MHEFCTTLLGVSCCIEFHGDPIVVMFKYFFIVTGFNIEYLGWDDGAKFGSQYLSSWIIQARYSYGIPKMTQTPLPIFGSTL